MRTCAYFPRVSRLAVPTFFSVSYQYPSAMSATDSHNVVALLDLINKLLLFFGFLLLRADEQKIENDEDQDQRQERDQVGASPRSALREQLDDRHRQRSVDLV